MSAHSALHMSPAQAAQASGVSRWTIMRAIKSHDLMAVRDNKNQWKISSSDLDAWMSSTVRTLEVAPVEHIAAQAVHTPEYVVELREALAAEKARADAAERARDQAEADRDKWQTMAQSLVERPSLFKFWTWKK